jgi:hypothetical protein
MVSYLCRVYGVAVDKQASLRDDLKHINGVTANSISYYCTDLSNSRYETGLRAMDLTFCPKTAVLYGNVGNKILHKIQY